MRPYTTPRLNAMYTMLRWALGRCPSHGELVACHGLLAKRAVLTRKHK